MRTPSSISPLQRQRGVSLVELMIGVTIGLAMLAALGSLYVATSKARAEFNKTGEQVENGRYALESMVRDVEMAGFFGRPGLSASLQYNLPGACTTAQTSMGFDNTTSPITVPAALSGVAAGGAKPTCLSNMSTGTEALTVHYASGNVSATVSGTEYYLQQSSCSSDTRQLIYDSKTANFTLLGKTCSSGSPAELRKYVVRTYYLSGCDNCSSGGDSTPTLKVAEFVNGSIQVSSLVAGIQDVHLSYGVDTDSNGSPDCYVDNPAIDNSATCTGSSGYSWTNATANWANITAVRVTVLARNLDPTTGWNDTRTYDLGRATADGPYNDSYKRHVYSAVARLWNVGGVREN
ncbi:PilW family protein [Dyella sp. 2RAB6]|uniref:PilW family protein n=1 Tax=Dyella sp. 2RAB6 TaxID=3232992 RepID=UPI003F8EFE5D